MAVNAGRIGVAQSRDVCTSDVARCHYFERFTSCSSVGCTRRCEAECLEGENGCKLILAVAVTSFPHCVHLQMLLRYVPLFKPDRERCLARQRQTYRDFMVSHHAVFVEVCVCGVVRRVVCRLTGCHHHLLHQVPKHSQNPLSHRPHTQWCLSLRHPCHLKCTCQTSSASQIVTQPRQRQFPPVLHPHGQKQVRMKHAKR
jgi:hypothetical protein